ncbi:uncharacterized protein LOC114841076 [Diachasma alloeum]|uniref:uncharacterized protein LOC114841076 n=1 Tax=Diachasma alloeum TaxID=454923 RepID=UPI0010FB9619|nr:uncharacterized protein LOC114841076 [Diachasma alloeum]
MSSPQMDAQRTDPQVSIVGKTPQPVTLEDVSASARPPTPPEAPHVDRRSPEPPAVPPNPPPNPPKPDPPPNPPTASLNPIKTAPASPIIPRSKSPGGNPWLNPGDPRPLEPNPRPKTPIPRQVSPHPLSDDETYDPPSRSRTPVYPRVVPSSKPPPETPKAFALDQTPISLINDQHEVELIPRRRSEEKRSLSLGDVDDTVTITKVTKRSKGVERPKTPVTRTDTPVLRPRTPVERPKTPVLRSRTPVERPKTPGATGERTRRRSALGEREMGGDERIEGEGEERRRRRRNNRDGFCWKCHKDEVEIACSTCVRSWHRRCIGGTPPSSPSDWICGECASILNAENASTRSPLMSTLTMDQLCMVLKHIILKMKRVTGSEEFAKPVDLADVANYLDYIVRPMDLTLLEANVRSKEYGSPDAFMADAKWILHNCLVYNTEGGKYTDTSRLTTVAKQLIKVTREELSELESCPTCYIRGRHLGRPHYTWFNDACKPPHLLVWAKLKGFPYWPAKIMPRWNQQGYVDVRFFGEHNRAWVSPKDIYLYSKDPPTATPKSKKEDIAECLREISIHIKRLGETFGRFEHAPPKTPFNPFDPRQITILLPDYEPPGGDYYRLPRRGPLSKGKKRKWDSMSDTYSEAYFYSDAETLADFNEGDDDEDVEVAVRGRETPKMRGSRRPETPGLPEASIPGKRAMTKVMKAVPLKRRSLTRSLAGGRRGARRRTAADGDKEEEVRVRATRQLPERVNSQGKSINKRTRASVGDPGRSKDAEDPKEEVEEKPKAEGRRQSKAKKTFPNRPPGMGVPGSPGKEGEGGLSPVKTEGSWWRVPSEAGPLSSLLSKGADTLAKQMALVIEEGVKMAAQGKGALAGSVTVDQALVFDMKMRMERMKWEHEQEIVEMKRNSEKEWKEIKTAMEAEQLRAIEEIQHSAEIEKARSIHETKQKQWCTSCAKESCMYCCWNTSYCSEKCQMKDWGQHQNKCKRKNRSPSKASVTGGGRVNGQKDQQEGMTKGIGGQSNFSYSRGA